jgi:hypothetical protein
MLGGDMAVLKPTSPATEEQLTMVPLPCLSISVISCCMQSHPFQVYSNGFIPIFLCAISRGAESPSIPALLKA